ncbi:hypothetical protein EZ313_13310 [Ramlibacter henchirensis]|jgi:hypothetical protein|uniref:Uncharacterized protein n=1 Tax=Ramlibacter henchirensis TaxID=204072 RepID=A0A4Z0BSH1_9BURK|nr:hypothetical protein [Ramlibacter henchirensis]TFZ02246.1 hypothetical protein EZ313_13310 [Ramlibacter henchirensis]
MPARRSEFVVVPQHQLGYLKVVCSAASRAAAKAQQSATAARAELADAVATGVKPAQLQHVWRLHREAVQKMNIVLFFGQLYVSAFRRHPPQGPTMAWDGQ